MAPPLVTLAAAAAAAAGLTGNISWTAYGANSTASAVGAAPHCPDGSPAPQSFLWNLLYNDHYADGGQTTPLSGLPSVATQQVATGYIASSWAGNEGFGLPPASIGPYCDKKAHPGCTPVFIFSNGGVPQNVSDDGPIMTAHLESLRTAADLTLPVDWDGVIGFDWEGWEPVYDQYLFTGYKNASMDMVRATHPSWTNESQIEAEAAIEFNAAARRFYEKTISFMREIRPKAQLGFYGTPSKQFGTWWNATQPVPNTTDPGYASHDGQHSINAGAQAVASIAKPVQCGSGHVNERYCYLPNETAGHVIKTVGPPFKKYLSGCCKLCAEDASCKAWSYESADQDHRCVLLDRDGATMKANETYQCVIGECEKVAPTPSPPSPSPTPGPHPPGPPTPGPPHLTPDQRQLQTIQAHNDALAWLWEQVDVLMPELYIRSEDNADYIRGMLRETERLVSAAHAAGNKKLAIVPFTWMRYGNNDTQFLDEAHLKAEFEVPFEFPNVESVLVWGDPAVGHVTTAEINAAFEGPHGLKQLIQTVGTAKCNCGKSMCSGHGRCYGEGGYSECQCFDGWSGDNCTKQLQSTTTLTSEVSRVPQSQDQDRVQAATAVCPDGISSCLTEQTCGQFENGRWGCCPHPGATLCGDARHCCPSGYACDKAAGVCYHP
jgi:hypothetical protein